MGKSEVTCRQILSRARRRIADERPRFDPDPEQRHALAARFLRAAREGSMDGLVALLAHDAVLIGDGGGKARAIPRPMVGGPQVARALSAFYGKAVEWGITLEPVLVNGQPGCLARGPDGRPLSQPDARGLTPSNRLSFGNSPRAAVEFWAAGFTRSAAWGWFEAYDAPNHPHARRRRRMGVADVTADAHTASR